MFILDDESGLLGQHCVASMVTALWYAAEAEVACSVFVASMVTALRYAAEAEVACSIFCCIDGDNGFVVRWLATASWCVGWERLCSASLVAAASWCVAGVDGFVVRRVSTAFVASMVTMASWCVGW